MVPHAQNCRLCDTALGDAVLDLGTTPLANRYLAAEELGDPEPSYPLRLYLCPGCGLVQLPAVVPPEVIFSRYQYLSSYSTTLLCHSERFAQEMTERLLLRPGDLVAEVASNDGYLLQYFARLGLDVLGVEPAANVAEVASARGIPTVRRFFGRSVAAELRREGRQADLLVANNVAAHVPDLHDFLGGLADLLAPGGTVSIEVHHLYSLVGAAQFDIVYHEHFQYFSLDTLTRALGRHGLAVFDADLLPTQGGSLRVLARHAGRDVPAPAPRLAEIRALEACARLADRGTYRTLAAHAAARKADLVAFLGEARRDGKTVVAVGAAAKGNTLLNYAGVTADGIDYCVDSNPAKQGLFLPGSRIPIRGPEQVARTRPDYLLILPWNLRDELMAQMAHVRQWGGHFAVPGRPFEIV